MDCKHLANGKIGVHPIVIIMMKRMKNKKIKHILDVLTYLYLSLVCMLSEYVALWGLVREKYIVMILHTCIVCTCRAKR